MSREVLKGLQDVVWSDDEVGTRSSGVGVPERLLGGRSSEAYKRDLRVSCCSRSPDEMTCRGATAASTAPEHLPHHLRSYC